ncbi:MAG: hypothetical protein ACQESZ_09045 [Bacteroidota bacterium]
MNSLKDKMMSIELKARTLIQDKEALKRQNELIIKENEALQQKLDQVNEQLTMQIKLNQYKHIATSLDDQGKKQTKLKINMLVREIDQCIALLND